ncbi:hypothetical protein K505DRAFT_142842 [Melanomma pulvis-pyrius CBS 109.77]|uniref:Mid2 domain-containing protein n=1 Tax=Melanomma pulvis-pyrius CBS 109.77 TaxID=1314802 RepID=A0A6A6XLL3_9PLEO|nr:hypothetical protein K505DRAFT_142842 [Melanomma pulvis-pyrius CBS 109.77]
MADQYTRVDDIHINSTNVLKNHTYLITWEADPISATYRIILMTDLIRPPEMQLTDAATGGSMEWYVDLDGAGLIAPEGEYRLILQNRWTASNRAYGDSFNLLNRESSNLNQLASSSQSSISAVPLLGSSTFSSISQQTIPTSNPSSTTTGPTPSTNNPALSATSRSGPAQPTSLGLGSGAKAGIVIGAVLGLLIIALAAFWLGRRRNNATTLSQEGKPPSWEKHEIDGNEIGHDNTPIIEMDSERPLQEMPHFHQTPAELPAGVPGYYESSISSSTTHLPNDIDLGTSSPT